jgi:ADP-ribose pyrophosphatase
MSRPPTFRLQSSKPVLTGRVFRLDRETWRGPDGSFTRETLVHPGAVAVLPRSGRDRYLLIRQFRAAARGWLLEIPAGTLEKGESALACAKRELVEETGFAARRWRKLGEIFVAPGYSTEVIRIYEASGLSPASAEKDEDEHIEVVEMSRRELARAARSGRIRDGKSVSALWLAGVT